MTHPPPNRDLARTTLAVLFIGLMIAASLWVLQLFIAATVWATMVVVATWPMMLAVEARLGGRRWLAVIVMTTAMLLVLVVPLVVAVATIVDHADDIAGWAKAALSAGVPSPPDWVEGIPVVGSKIAGEWQQLAATRPEDLAAQAAPYVRKAVQWFAGQAIRAVALGVVVTAIVQSTAAGIGLAVSGVPYVTVLTAVIFMLCIAQLGPILVLAPAVGWLYWSGDPVWGTVLLVWTVLVGGLDNVLRPILIKRGADLPLLLIFAGVIGGLVSFGIIGLFVGPVILAVTYRLLESWVADIDREQESKDEG